MAFKGRVQQGNAMRWDCHARGCFNVKKRPKINVFADCFPRRINFGDVDGLVEMSGRFLMLEWKPSAADLSAGQQRSLIAFSRQQRGNLVLVVAGDAETMRVHAVRPIWLGRLQAWEETGLDGLKDRIRKWVHLVDGHR